MADRWRLLLDDQQIMWGKNELPAQLMTVFQERDKYMQDAWTCRIDQINSTPGTEDIVFCLDDASDLENSDDLFGYGATVETVLTRLKLMGFTPTDSRREMAAVLQELREWDGEDALYHTTGSDTEPVRYDVSCEDVVTMGLTAYLNSCTSRGPTKATSDCTKIERLCVDRLVLFFEDLHEDPRLLLSALLYGQDPTRTLKLDLLTCLQLTISGARTRSPPKPFKNLERPR